MGVVTAILAVLSVICMALGIVNILNASTEPILNVNLTWTFWMAMAGFLMLCVIALLLLTRLRLSGN
jgi:hypothetical protein